MSKLQKLESTPYTPTHDTRSPDACESIAFHFWYRHACIVMYVFSPCGRSFGFTFPCWWCFFKKKTFIARFFSAYKEGKPGRQVCTMPGLSGESRGRRVFGRGVADATLVGWRTCFTLFSEPSTGTSCRVKIWRAASWPPARMAALWTSSVSRDPVLFFWRKRWPTRDAFVVTGNSRSFNLFGNEKSSHKDWDPFKTAGENVSSTTKRQVSGIRWERWNELCQSKKKAGFN